MFTHEMCLYNFSESIKGLLFETLPTSSSSNRGRSNGGTLNCILLRGCTGVNRNTVSA